MQTWPKTCALQGRDVLWKADTRWQEGFQHAAAAARSRQSGIYRPFADTEMPGDVTVTLQHYTSSIMLN